MKNKDKIAFNFIFQNFGIEISPFLEHVIANPQILYKLNNALLKRVVVEFAPIYQKHFLDGPNQLARFKMSLFCRVMNKPELLNLLETNADERQGEIIGIPIYFSKIEFVERIDSSKRISVISLNLVEKELGYQIFEGIHRAPVIQASMSEACHGKRYNFDVGYPACKIRNSQTGFKEELIKLEDFEENVVFSYGIKLSDEQFENLLLYCNALSFEPFRNKEMSWDDDGIIGVRDCVSLDFRAITDDYIPKIELPMIIIHGGKHMWPSEKLYKHIVTEIFDKDKNLKGQYTSYGGLSLFGVW